MVADEKTIGFLGQKSIESFLLAVEIFNKPTIRYRLEGCVFSLCNAWELLLKAKMLREGRSILYPNKAERSLSLSDCLKAVFTNENDPVRQNLEIIISLRNTSTHFIIPEYEFSFVPFLAFCVKSYASKLYEFLGERINDYIRTDFLSLFTNTTAPNRAELLTKYGEDMIAVYDKKNRDLAKYLNCEEGSSVAFSVRVNLVRISNKAKADYTFYASNSPSDEKIRYVEKLANPNTTHPYTHHGIANEVNQIITRDKIPFVPIKEPVPTQRNPNPAVFTTACLDVLIRRYRIKENTDYAVKVENGKLVVYKYSRELITWVIAGITNDKEFVVKAKAELGKK